MRVGVDSSVIITLLQGEETHRHWLEYFIDLRRRARLFVCDVVYAEVSGIYHRQIALDQELAALGVVFDPINTKTAFAAGYIHYAYRKAGGSRVALVPDFLIAAHAMTQCDGLMTSDRGYLRAHFRGLQIFEPTAR